MVSNPGTYDELGTAHRCDSWRWTNFYMGASAFLGIWFYSMMDAPRAARRYNAKADRTTARVEPIITSERVGAAIAF